MAKLKEKCTMWKISSATLAAIVVVVAASVLVSFPPPSHSEEVKPAAAQVVPAASPLTLQDQASCETLGGGPANATWDGGTNTCTIGPSTRIYTTSGVIMASGVTLQGNGLLKINPATAVGVGLELLGSNTVDGVFVDGSNVSLGNPNAAIRTADTGSNNHILNTTAFKSAHVGIWLAAHGDTLENVTASYNDSTGIEVRFNDNVTLDTVTVVHNYYGIRAQSNLNLVITGGTVSGNTREGIFFVYDVFDAEITNLAANSNEQNLVVSPSVQNLYFDNNNFCNGTLFDVYTEYGYTLDESRQVSAINVADNISIGNSYIDHGTFNPCTPPPPPPPTLYIPADCGEIGTMNVNVCEVFTSGTVTPKLVVVEPGFALDGNPSGQGGTKNLTINPPTTDYPALTVDGGVPLPTGAPDPDTGAPTCTSYPSWVEDVSISGGSPALLVKDCGKASYTDAVTTGEDGAEFSGSYCYEVFADATENAYVVSGENHTTLDSCDTSTTSADNGLLFKKDAKGSVDNSNLHGTKYGVVAARGTTAKVRNGTASGGEVGFNAMGKSDISGTVLSGAEADVNVVGFEAEATLDVSGAKLTSTDKVKDVTLGGTPTPDDILKTKIVRDGQRAMARGGGLLDYVEADTSSSLVAKKSSRSIYSDGRIREDVPKLERQQFISSGNVPNKAASAVLLGLFQGDVGYTESEMRDNTPTSKEVINNYKPGPTSPPDPAQTDTVNVSSDLVNDLNSSTPIHELGTRAFFEDVATRTGRNGGRTLVGNLTLESQSPSKLKGVFQTQNRDGVIKDYEVSVSENLANASENAMKNIVYLLRGLHGGGVVEDMRNQVVLVDWTPGPSLTQEEAAAEGRTKAIIETDLDTGGEVITNVDMDDDLGKQSVDRLNMPHRANAYKKFRNTPGMILGANQVLKEPLAEANLTMEYVEPQTPPAVTSQLSNGEPTMDELTAGKSNITGIFNRGYNTVALGMYDELPIAQTGIVTKNIFKRDDCLLDVKIARHTLFRTNYDMWTGRFVGYNTDPGKGAFDEEVFLGHIEENEDLDLDMKTIINTYCPSLEPAVPQAVYSCYEVGINNPGKVACRDTVETSIMTRGCVDRMLRSQLNMDQTWKLCKDQTVNREITGPGEGILTLPGPGHYVAVVRVRDIASRSYDYATSDLTIDPSAAGISKVGKINWRIADTTRERLIPLKTRPVHGSILWLYEPVEILWDGDTAIYPFAFESDSDWTADVCLEVPEGYVIAEGQDCQQVFVAGDTKVIEFVVDEVGSVPGPSTVKYKLKGPDGKVQKLESKIDVKLSKELAKKKGIDIDKYGRIIEKYEKKLEKYE